MLNTVADNVWAFLMILVGAAVAVLGARWASKDLLAFGSTVAGYGAGIFRSKTQAE